MRNKINRRSVWVVLSLLFLMLGLEQPIEASPNKSSIRKKFRLDQKDPAQVQLNGNTLYVFIKPKNGEGPYQFAARVLKKGFKGHRDLKKYMRGKPLQLGKFVKIPFGATHIEIQKAALKAIFPKDSMDTKGWNHKVLYSGETLGLISGLFAKTGISYRAIAKHNRLKRDGKNIKVGDVIRIPMKWIRPELRSNPLRVKPPLVHPGGSEKFVYYKLKKDQTIYSSVIIRFTGRVLSNEVNRLASELMALNNLKDSTHIPAGYRLKIPISWISEDYLEGNGNLEVEQVVTRKRSSSKTAKRKSKETFHIILDPGHGGVDPGATRGSYKQRNAVYEDEVVYDVALRMKAMLKGSNFQVHMTLKDPNQTKPVKRLSYKKDEDEVLLVHPVYPLKHARTGVNMRVYLMNHIYASLRKKGVPQENILFMSIHGDALHKSIRGAMVYYPDHRLRKPEFRLSQSVYRKRKEFRRLIKFSKKENQRVAANSKAFGKTVIQSFRDVGLRVKKESPLRSYHYRNNKKSLPGVLRYSKIPMSVLVEVANLNNPQDLKAVQNYKTRDKIAKALVLSIRRTFEHSSENQVASR